MIDIKLYINSNDYLFFLIFKILARVSTPKENFKINLESISKEKDKENPIKSSKENVYQNENEIQKHILFSEENKNTNLNLNNKYIDKQYTIISENTRSFASSSNKTKNSSLNSFKLNNKKESFITDSKLTSDYFGEKTESVNDYVKTNENNDFNNMKIQRKLKFNSDSNKKSDRSKKDLIKGHIEHKNCHLKEKRQSYLNILKI